MDRSKLVEIKSGEVGTGLLIEHDGYISMSEGKNKQLFESIIKEDIDGDSPKCPYPFIVSAVFQKYNIENANGRIYPENVLKREVEKYQQKIRERRAYGEANHPSESVIDISRIAINITELHWENQTLVGEMEILTTEGFRKHGIVSTCGDEVANILLHGLKIGVSSRGLGTVTQKMGVLYVADDYEIVCWDVVSDPSTPNAWISERGQIPQQYIESKDTTKSKLIENLEQFNDWLCD